MSRIEDYSTNELKGQKNHYKIKYLLHISLMTAFRQAFTVSLFPLIELFLKLIILYFL